MKKYMFMFLMLFVVSVPLAQAKTINELSDEFQDYLDHSSIRRETPLPRTTTTYVTTPRGEILYQVDYGDGSGYIVDKNRDVYYYNSSRY